jgi:hypothetical protein
MFRASKYAANISENDCSRCSTSIIDFFSISITEQSVIAVAEQRRRGCPVKTTFTEEIAHVQNADCRFLPIFRDNGEFYLRFLYAKNNVGRVALSKDHLLFGKRYDCRAAVDGCKECVVSNLRCFAAAATGVMIGLLSQRWFVLNSKFFNTLPFAAR